MGVIYIVVPCYNEAEVIEDTNAKLLSLLSEMIDGGLVADESRICYVNDGSRDETWNMITRFHKENNHIRGIKLSRNYGHQNALVAGLETIVTQCDATITIDADLQDDIHVIPEMVSKYNDGCDVVYGVRKERTTDSFFKRNTALAFYKTMSLLGVESVYNHADFRLMSRRAVEGFMKYTEKNLYLRGIIPLVGYRSDVVYYSRLERMAGTSKYPLKKMLEFALNGITSFSTKPLRFMIIVGVIMLFISLAIFVYIMISYLTHNTIAGWTSMMLSVWFVGGMIITCIGIMGEYVGKIYIEVKNRPRYNVEEVLK